MNAFRELELRELHLALAADPFSALTHARAKHASTVAGFALLWAAGLVPGTKQFLGFDAGSSGIRVTVAALLLVLHAVFQWGFSVERDRERRDIRVGHRRSKALGTAARRLVRASESLDAFVSAQARTQSELAAGEAKLAQSKLRSPIAWLRHASA